MTLLEVCYVQSNSNGLSPYWLIVFLAIWVAVMGLSPYFSSVVSGWHMLSKRFRAHTKFPAETRPAWPYFYVVSMRNWADYSSIIRMAAEEDALYLRVSFAYRIGHPPLCIPWNEIQFGKTKSLWRRYVVLTLGEQERIPMRISERMANKLGLLERLPDSQPA